MAAIPINSVSPTPNPFVKHASKSHVSRFRSFPQSILRLRCVPLDISPNNGVFNLPKLSIFSKEYGDRSLHKSFKYIGDMVSKGYKPDDASQVYRLLHDLFRCCKFNRSRFRETASLIQILEDNCFLTTVVMYNIVIEQHCLFGDFKRVRLYMDRMIRRGIVPSSHTYSILLDGACKETGVDAAMKLLDDVISKGISPNLVSYNTLLAVLSKSNRVDDAIKFYRDFPSLGLTPDAVTYNILVSTLCLEERWDEAKEILAEMVDAGCLPDEDMFHTLISALALHGRTDDALGLIKEMVRKGFDPTATMYNPIITNLCKQRKVDDVVECLDEMRYSRCEPNDGTYNALAVLCEEGMVKEAFSIIESLRDTENFDSVNDFYDCVLSALCTERNTYPAFHLLYEMTNHGFTPCSYTYSYLIRGLCAEGMENMALQITGIMEESGCKATSGNYNALLYSLSISGKLYSMIEVIISMIEKGCRPSETTYFLLLCYLANGKDKDLAVLVLKELNSRRLVRGHKTRKLIRDYDLGDILEGSRKKENGEKRKP